MASIRSISHLLFNLAPVCSGFQAVYQVEPSHFLKRSSLTLSLLRATDAFYYGPGVT